MTRTLDGAGKGLTYTYDLGGRRTQAMTTAGSSQQYEYDAFGNITGVVDGEGNRTQYILDEWGRIVEIKRADGASEFYRYDYAGNITRTIDGEGNAAQYEYGANGQLIRMTDPAGESETYGYDLGNRLCRKTDRNGVTTTYTYNLYGSLTGRRAQNPAVPGTRRSETYEYTPEGLLKSAISSGSDPDAPGVRTMGMRYSYEYDVMNRLIQKSASGRTLLSFAYDLNGNLIRQEDVTGKVTKYSYNDIDILENIKDNDHQAAEYTYYPDGTIKSLRNGSLYTEYL